MYSQTLSDPATIPATDFALCSLLFVPVRLVNSAPDFISVQKSPDEADAVEYPDDFSLKAGGAFYTFTDLLTDASFSEEQKPAESGTWYDVALKFILNGDTFDDRGKLLRKMSREPFLVIVKHDGAWRLLGSVARGADFSYKYESEKQRHLCVFSWESANACLYINI